MKSETEAIHVGEEPNFKEGGSGDVVIPLHLSSTFARLKVAEPTGGYEYSRSGNPTRNALEKRLAVLEKARFALAYASGSAAETSLLLTLLQNGDHMIVGEDLYGGTRRLMEKIFANNFSISLSFVDATNTQNVSQAIRKNTRLIWLESPTNPLLKMCDFSAIASIAKDHEILVVADNTFMSPYFQKPLLLGADIVVHSTTKYINGHSDSIGGAIMLDKEDIFEKLKFNQNALGTMLSPFDSYLVLRGIKTLAVRMREHEKNAQCIATYLATHPQVEKVIYPGLPHYAQAVLAKQQLTGYGGMLSFELKGDLSKAEKFLEHLTLFAVAESLGGVESLVELPALMTHASIPKIQRQEIGISDSLIRMSIGIEHIDDLLEDIDQALGQIGARQ